jgi:cytochrome c-type biogenesis protein CcmH/NrfG
VRIHARKGYFAGLHATADEMPEPDGEVWEVTLQRVDQALKSGDFKQMASGLEKLLRKFPNETSLWFNLGAARLRLGDPAAAVEAFQKAFLLAPEDRAVGRSLVQALVAAGYVEAAVEQMEALVRRHPRDMDLLVQLGRVFEIEGNTERAFRAYRRILDLTLAPPPEALLLLTRTAVGLRRDAEARIYIRDYLALGGEAAAIEPWRLRVADGSPIADRSKP